MSDIHKETEVIESPSPSTASHELESFTLFLLPHDSRTYTQQQLMYIYTAFKTMGSLIGDNNATRWFYDKNAQEHIPSKSMSADIIDTINKQIRNPSQELKYERSPFIVIIYRNDESKALHESADFLAMEFFEKDSNTICTNFDTLTQTLRTGNLHSYARHAVHNQAITGIRAIHGTFVSLDAINFITNSTRENKPSKIQ